MLQAMSAVSPVAPVAPTSNPLPEGKLDREQLSELLRSTSQAHPDILVGAAAGEDAAVVRAFARQAFETAKFEKEKACGR